MNFAVILCVLLTWMITYIQKVDSFLTDRVTYSGLPPTDYTLRDLTRETILKVVADYFEDSYPSQHNPGDLAGLNPLTASTLFQAHYGALGPPFDDCVASGKFEAAIEEIITSNIDVAVNMAANGEYHFENEQIATGSAMMVSIRNTIISGLGGSSPDYTAVRTDIGKYLHMLQSFYSNTNWVEIQQQQTVPMPHPDLGCAQIKATEVAIPFMGMCSSCPKIGTVSSPPQPNEYDCSNNLVNSPLLTSGYRNGATKPLVVTTSTDKCNHGGTGDSSWMVFPIGGINKETSDPSISPHHNLHDEAAALAIEAGIQFFNIPLKGLRNVISDAKFEGLLNLATGSTLALVIDDTGSMGDEIDAVKASAIQLVTEFAGTCLAPSQYIISPFNDPGTGPVTDTTDSTVAIAALQSLYAHGGQDCPELALTGILNALNIINFPTTMYVWTDADEKDSHLLPTVNALALSKSATFNFILTGDCGLSGKRKKRAVSSTFVDLAEMTGGSLYMTTNAEVGDVSNIIVADTRASQVSVLQWRADNDGSIPTPVDNTMQEVLITVSGQSAGSVTTICDPAGNAVPTSSDLIDVTVNSAEVFSFFLNTDTHGDWTMKLNGIRSGEEVDVDISTRSLLDFNYKILEEASGIFIPFEGLPSAGSDVIFQVNVISPEIAGTIDRIVLRNMKGQAILIEGELTAVGGLSVGLYTAEVTLPNEPFTVSIQGTDQDGNNIQRLRPGVVQVLGFRLERGDSTGELVPGGSETLGIRFINFGAQDSYSVDVSTTAPGDATPVTVTVTPTTISLASEASDGGMVMIAADSGASVGESSVVTVTMTSQTSGKQNFLTRRFSVAQPFTVDESIPVDAANPTCSVQETTGTCSLAMINTDCATHMWSTRVALQDDLVIAEYIVSDFQESSGSQYTVAITDASSVVVSYEANCCCPKVDFTVVDIAGNIATCGIDDFTPNVDNVVDLSQCGLTDDRQACVQGLRVVGQTSTQISIAWSASITSCMADDYLVQYRILTEEQCHMFTEEQQFLNLPRINDDVTTATITDLEPFSMYLITLTPKRSVTGDGPIELITHQTSFAVPVGVPTNIVIMEKTDSTLMLSWDGIACGLRGGQIQHYVNQFVSVSGDENTASALTTERSYEKTHLPCNTQYRFRVAGVNNIGMGPFSDDLEVATEFSPEPFELNSELIIRSVTPTTADVSWRRSACPASDFTVEYTLMKEDQCIPKNIQQVTTFGRSEGKPMILTDLKPFSQYMGMVRAETTSGTTQSRQNIFNTSEEVPIGSPVNITSTSLSSTLTYTWDPVPCGERRGDITGYVYEIRHPDGIIDSNSVITTTVTLVNLIPDRQYGFRVRARNSIGLGPFSDETLSQTEPVPQPTPMQIDCSGRPATTCPFGYRQTDTGLCEVSRIIRLALRVTEIAGVPQDYRTDLATDDEFNCRIYSQVEAALERLHLFDKVEILGYSPGSIIVDMALIFDNDSVVTASDVNGALRNAAGDEGELGNGLRVQLTDSAEDLCPVAYCENGGTCITSDILLPNECRCVAGFEGDKCEIPIVMEAEDSVEDNDERVTVAIIVITGAILIVGIVVLSYFCHVLICRRRGKASLFRLPNPSANRSNQFLTQSLQLVDPVSNVPPWTFGEPGSLLTSTNLPYFDDLQNAVMPMSFGLDAALPRDNLWGFGNTYPWQSYF